MNEWLANEKKYFKDIIPLLTALSPGKGKPKAGDVSQKVTFEQLFPYSPDRATILATLEKPLPDESLALEDGKWVYSGKSERALIVALADAIKQRAKEGNISLKKGISANSIAEALASHLGVEDWPSRAYRARYQNGIRNDGPAFDYQEFKRHFLAIL